MGYDPWCKPSCGDGQCSGDAWDPADPNDRADGMLSNWSCPESPESCPQDCSGAKQEESSDPADLEFHPAPFCGNGRCEDVTCSEIGCPEAETQENCEADCGRFLGVDPVGTAAP